MPSEQSKAAPVNIMPLPYSAAPLCPGYLSRDATLRNPFLLGRSGSGCEPLMRRRRNAGDRTALSFY